MAVKKLLSGHGSSEPEAVIDAGSSGLTLKGSPKWKISRMRFAEGPSDGVEVVDLNNGKLTVSVIPTRGMGIWRFVRFVVCVS